MSFSPDIDRQLAAILAAVAAETRSRETDLNHLNRRLTSMTKSLDDILVAQTKALAAIQADTDLDNSIAALVASQKQTLADLRQQLADAMASNDPVKLQQVADNMDAINAAIDAQATAAAVTAGT